MGEVAGVAKFVGRILKKDPVSHDEVANQSEFYILCLKRMVNFYELEQDAEPAAKKAKSNKGERPFGLKALEMKIHEFQVAVKKNEPFGVKATEPFRLYEFALDDRQRKLTQEFIKQALLASQAGLTKHLSLKDHEKDIFGSSKSGAASSASGQAPSKAALVKATSSSSLLFSPAPHKKAGSGVAQDDVKKQSCDLLRFFGNGVVASRG